MQVQPDHRRPHLRAGHEAVGRHIRHDIRLRIILYSQRQGAIILGTRSGLHPIRHLFLYHDGYALYRDVIFKKPHNDRSRNIIRQIRHHFDRPASILLLCQLRDIHLQDVFIDHLYVVISIQRIFQDRDQRPVDLHRDHTARRARQILSHRPDTGPDLQHTILLRDLRGPDDLVQHMSIDQKVLPELLLKHKIIFLQHRDRILRIS